MPSEQRLHPATLLFAFAKHLKQFALPSLLLVLGMSRSTGGPDGMFGGMPAGWEFWLLVLFVPATAASILRYVSLRLRYEERELVIRSGLIFRRERHIPFSRIQNVDGVQNLFHRLFGVVDVRLETGGGEEEEARLSVLPVAALTELRSRVFARAPSPALILLDLNLPGLKGIDLLPQLRSMSAYQTTPVIVVTGSDHTIEEPRCLQLGANAYVEKAADFDTFFASIQTIVREWLGAECS